MPRQFPQDCVNRADYPITASNVCWKLGSNLLFRGILDLDTSAFHLHQRKRSKIKQKKSVASNRGVANDLFACSFSLGGVAVLDTAGRKR